MAFLAFAEPGNAGYARVVGSGLARAPRPVQVPTPVAIELHEEVPVLNELERSVIGIARRDGLSTLRKPGRLSHWLGVVFGVRISPQLADPKLEALRRIAVLSWKRGYSIASAEVKAFIGAGYSPAFYEMVVDTIASARQQEARRGRI